MTTVAEIIAAQARLRPGAAAVTGAGREALSFRELHVQVEEVSARMRAMGMTRNDRVAIAVPTCSERFVLQLAVMNSCIAAPLNPSAHEAEIEEFLLRLQAAAVIGPAGGESAALRVAAKLGIPSVELVLRPHGPAGLFGLKVPGGDRPTKGALPAAGMARPEDVVLLLQTSGTTARPKLVPLTHANICAGAGNICATLALGPEDRLLSVLQLHHIAGISLGLASLAVGGSVFVTPGFSAPDFFPWLEEARATWVWAAPAMLHEIVMRAARHRETIERSTLRLIRVGSAPLPAHLKSDAERIFHVPVLENYGMTEASPQIASVPLPPRRSVAGSVGLPVGLDVEIAGEKGELLPRGGEGEVIIRGDCVMKGYLDDKTSNEDAFLHGWFRTGDQGYLNQDGFLFLTGRVKEVINRGGEKVSPLEVDRAILAHPAVEDAVTFPVPHPILGEEIAAAVVLRPGHPLTEQELQEFVLHQLPLVKVPRQVCFVAEIPADERGKVQRRTLARRLGLGTSDEQLDRRRHEEAAEHRTPVERQLTGIWRDVLKLGDDRVSVQAQFLDLGGDSVSAAQIMARVRRIFDIDLSPVVFFGAPTIGELARIIESKRDAESFPPPAGKKGAGQ